MKKPTVLVTGSNGYIGGQVGYHFQDTGWEVVGLDRRGASRPWRSLGMNCSAPLVGKLLDQIRPDVVVHCAGTSLVGPSMQNPGEYYTNNVTVTVDLLESIRHFSPETHFVFASSAATYGNPTDSGSLIESSPTKPISPYGTSKLMIEEIMADYQRAYDMKMLAFRFFNVCGADPKGRHGQEKSATHIIARLLESVKDDETFTMYGNDYATPDGSCIRDYIHVSDLAEAIFVSVHKDLTGVYNIASGMGYSNLEILKTVEEVTGRKVKLEIGPRRVGDPDRLVASGAKLTSKTGWARRYDLKDIIEHAWNWYVRKDT